MAFEKVVAVFLALTVCIASIEAGALSRKRSASIFDGELVSDQRTPADDDYSNHLLMALIDAVITDAELRGANQEQLGNLMRKRSGIRKCFFHAVNCW